MLVVDDDKTCCEGTVATLNEIGIDGEWVLSGKEAVERAVNVMRMAMIILYILLTGRCREWMELKQQSRYAKR